MKNMQTFVAALGLVGTAAAWGHGGEWNETTSYTTITTDIYTTFCPSPTEVTIGTKTYTVTSSQTLTITDCPCTITKPVKPTSSPSVLPTQPTTSAQPTHSKPQNTTSIPTHSRNATTTTPPVTTTAFTTFCPSPTTFTHGNQTFTATGPTTFTIPTTAPVTSFTHITSFFTTSVPPGSTAVVISGTTFPVTAPGEVTIPIVSASPLPPASTESAPAPGETTHASTAPAESTPASPAPAKSSSPAVSASPTPLQITNNGVQSGASLGAFVAGLVALLV